MKFFKTRSTFVLIFFLGCVTTSNVTYDYDESINFNNYATFVIYIDDLFVQNTKFPNYDNTYIRQYLAEEFENKMIQLGYKTNEQKPELQVGFKLVVSEEQVTFTNCDKEIDFNYWEKCTISTETYTNETLIAYVSNFEKNQVIWQASVPCDFNKSKKALPGYVKEITKKLFDEYPKILN
jgi:hypothetical protein